MNRPMVSFEYFPPKSAKALDKLVDEAKMLATLQPDFMTVTYGAGGSTKEGTLDAVQAIRKATNVPTAMHLTFINTPIDELNKFTDHVWDLGIRHIVALRGDMPEDLAWPLDTDADYYQFSSDFVTGLKARHDFEISVGAYPEKHPDSPSVEADVIALKKKQDAGADRAITQFFFDNDLYFRFVERCYKAGVTIPIVPGLLPISDFNRMLTFAERCQASVPQWLHEKFAAVTDEQGHQELAAELLTTQIEELSKGGVPHLHFYTLNKAGLTAKALEQADFEDAVPAPLRAKL